MPWSEQKQAVSRQAEVVILVTMLFGIGLIALFCGPSS
jgi:hypothetical protein